MRLITGTAGLEVRAPGRVRLVLSAATGERFAIDRSPDQLRGLREQIDAALAPAEDAPDAAQTTNDAPPADAPAVPPKKGKR